MAGHISLSRALLGHGLFIDLLTGGMNRGHSPGPWEIDERFLANDTQPNFRIFAANLVCELAKPQGFYRAPAENEANARLIAAGPDLLAALEFTRMVLESMPDEGKQYLPGNMLTIIRAALAKAKGGA